MLLNRKVVDVAAPNLIIACIDESPNNKKMGRLNHKYSREPVPFTDLYGLLLEADRLMDIIDFPQSSTRDRFFLDETHKRMKEKGVKQVRTADEILDERGKRATFVINVLHRQNATWQGKVLWAEKGKSCCFRSALELLKLIDNALDEGEELDSQQELS